MNKEKHTSCRNCEQRQRVIFKNVIFCFGLIKKRHKPKDYYRFCILKGDNKNCTDIMLEEIYSLLSGLSKLLLDKKIKDLSKRKRNER